MARTKRRKPRKTRSASTRKLIPVTNATLYIFEYNNENKACNIFVLEALKYPVECATKIGSIDANRNVTSIKYIGNCEENKVLGSISRQSFDIQLPFLDDNFTLNLLNEAFDTKKVIWFGIEFHLGNEDANNYFQAFPVKVSKKAMKAERDDVVSSIYTLDPYSSEKIECTMDLICMIEGTDGIKYGFILEDNIGSMKPMYHADGRPLTEVSYQADGTFIANFDDHKITGVDEIYFLDGLSGITLYWNLANQQYEGSDYDLAQSYISEFYVGHKRCFEMLSDLPNLFIRYEFSKIVYNQ